MEDDSRGKAINLEDNKNPETIENIKSVDKAEHTSEHTSEPDDNYDNEAQTNLEDENEQEDSAGWPTSTLKIFFNGLKTYGRDYDKINDFMRNKISTFNKRKSSFRFLFRRLLKKIHKYLEQFLKKNEKKIPVLQHRNFTDTFLDLASRTSLNELKMLIAYGELYCADLFPDTPLPRHHRKLYQLLSVGSTNYMKNGRIFTLKMPPIKESNALAPQIPTQSKKVYQKLPTYVLTMQRLMLELRPKSLAVLILMKQRAFNPNIRLDIPMDLKVQDLVDRLMDYWRFPCTGLRNILTIFHLVQKEKQNYTIEKENEFIVRNLLPTEYIADIHVLKDQKIQLLYDLNSQLLPDINDSLLSQITLNILSKLAKIHLTSLNKIQPEAIPSLPKTSYKYAPIAPSNKSMSCARLQHFKAARIRPPSIPIEKKVIGELLASQPSQPLLKGKRRIIPIPLNVPKPTPPTAACQPISEEKHINTASMVTEESQSKSSIVDFKFRIFGSSKIDETTVSDPQPNIIDDNGAGDYSNFSKDSYNLDFNNPNAFNDAINNFPDYLLTNLNNTAISNDLSSLLHKEMLNDETNISTKGVLPKYSHIGLINEDSNLGFQQHFGSLQPSDLNHSITLNKSFSYNNEDSMPASTTIPSGVLETPKFDTKKPAPKTNQPERSSSVVKKLFAPTNTKF